ncbi:MAG: PDZ domain-containing protein [Candidatus Zixiibacteriota bacterium]
MSLTSNKLTWTRKAAWVAIPLAVVLIFGVGFAKTGDGYLGVYISDIDEDLQAAEDLPSTDGVMVTEVVDGSPAEEAGLKRGDVILKYGEKTVSSTRRLTRMIEWTEPGEKIALTVLRGGKESTLSATIGEDEGREMTVWSWSGDDDGPAVTIPPTPDVPMAPRAGIFSLGQVSSSRIGVSLNSLSDQLAEAYGATDGGALITEVEKDSPAEDAGLKAGDVIVEVDHKAVEDVDDIRRAISKKKEGEKVAVRVLRPLDHTDLTVDVEVEESSTWSGFGSGNWTAPHVGRIEIPEFDTREWRSAQREYRDAMREVRDDWREELEAEMEKLREELKELRQELREKGR